MLLLIPVSVTIGSWERIACREECFGEASRPQSRSSLRIFRPSLTDADKLNCQMSRKGLIWCSNISVFGGRRFGDCKV